MIAGFLLAQFENAEVLLAQRLKLWDTYHEAFAGLEAGGYLRRPIIPDECAHNPHIYYLLLPELLGRSRLLDALRQAGIQATFDYLKLHCSPECFSYICVGSTMAVTDATADTLVRLPLWYGMEAVLPLVIDAVHAALDGRHTVGP